MRPAGSHHQIRLADGRAVGWSEYGEPHGYPVLSCHGGLSCRLDAAPCDSAARELGVRVISPDRPGVGLSDRTPAPSLLGFTRDVAELLDRLAIGRFAVAGWSLGGAYAAACGAALAARVSSVALIAAVIPLDAPGAAAEVHPLDRTCLAAARCAPAALGAVLRLSSLAAALAPGLFTRISRLTFDRDARALLRRRPDVAPAAWAAEGLRKPGGAIDDYRVLDRPWGFALSQITAPVAIWQGDSDGFVPLSWARQLAARIPDAGLRLCPGAGHFLAFDRYPAIFTELIAAGG